MCNITGRCKDSTETMNGKGCAFLASIGLCNKNSGARPSGKLLKCPQPQIMGTARHLWNEVLSGDNKLSFMSSDE